MDDIIKKISIKVFAFSIILSFLTGYFYFKKYDIKEYKTQIEKLLEDIYKKSYEKNFKGLLSEIKEIKGPESDEIINLLLITEIKTGLLSKESPYTLIIEPAEFEKEIKALKENLKLRNIPDEKISEIIIKKTRKAIKVPDYKVELKWDWEDKSNGYIRLNFKISSINFIESSIVITNPKYERNYYQKKEFLKLFFYIFSSLSLISLLIIIFIETKLYLIKKKLLKNIPQLKENLNSYASGGSFVAANNEIEKFLKYLPDNSDLISLKQELMGKTNNNPQEAEKMYRKYKLIEAKVNGRKDINPEELEELKKINEFIQIEGIAALIGRIEKVLKEKEVMEKSNKAKELIKEGRINEARNLIENIKAGYMANSENLIEFEGELTKIKNNIDKAKEESENIFNEAKKYLNNGEIKKAEELFNLAIQKNSNLDEAKKILDEIKKSRNCDKYILLPNKSNIGKKIYIFKKKEITLFRADKKIPDIELNFPTVSRDSHLEIAIRMNKIIAQDQNSKNGTKISGEIIKNNAKREIEDGAIIDFNGAYQITAHIYKGGIFNQNTVFVGKETISPDLINKKQEEEILSFILEGNDERIFIILLDKIPIKFCSLGIIYDNSSNIFIYNKDGICFIKFPESSQIEIIYPEKEIDYKGVRYNIK